MADTDTSTGTDAGSNPDGGDSPFRDALTALSEAVDSLEFDAREFEAAVAGGLAGGFQAAVVLQVHDTDSIRRVGAVFGAPTLDGGWLAMFALGVLFALPFSLFVSSSIDSFVQKVMLLSSKNDHLRTVLVPLLKRSALTTTTLGLGNGYGAAVGVVVSLFLMPIWLTVVMDVPTMIPNLTVDGLFGVVAWILYGGTLGLVYGLLLEYR
ncbi:hypothetical protein [Haloterrigena alkaliphila]|uniref:Uncharacterized protein n=1 Tax=Haloterrigena alkaliphila TaxID=2816475 RepID=A0A8A2VCV6_9EURY|nr:hypothetical protein [Haloterrigena alkaliphila]QSW99859.1 hypothetical protein J0X25_02535 [Haloterrigena alkaliphila]